jgi:hypothetical protein
MKNLPRMRNQKYKRRITEYFNAMKRKSKELEEEQEEEKEEQETTNRVF